MKDERGGDLTVALISRDLKKMTVVTGKAYSRKTRESRTEKEESPRDPPRKSTESAKEKRGN